MKKIWILICLLLILTACSKTSAKPIEFEGERITFVMVMPEDSEETYDIPYVSVCMKDNYAVFQYDGLDSSVGPGSYELEDNILTLRDTDGKHKDGSVYVFRVLDEQTIEFMEEESSEIIFINEKIRSFPITDGTKFVAEIE